MQKIISKHCELVKLYHINRSGPGFFETQYILFILQAVRPRNAKCQEISQVTSCIEIGQRFLAEVMFTDRQTDRQTDRHTDIQTEPTIGF